MSSDLLEVVKSGNLVDIQKYITAGADINFKDSYGQTAIILASHGGSIEIVKYLLEKGADINAKNDEGLTALISALSCQNYELAQLLVESGAEIPYIEDSTIAGDDNDNDDNDNDEYEDDEYEDDDDEYDDEITIFDAAANGDLDLVKYFVENGTDINSQYVSIDINNDTTPNLIDTSFNGDDLVTTEYYIENTSTNLDTEIDTEIETEIDTGSEGATSLMFASANGYFDIVIYLVESGADINIKNNEGNTALIIAQDYGHDKIVAYLKQIIK